MKRWELAGMRNVKDRSKKDCCCGGHNAHNVKRNLNHHGTLMRLWYKVRRKLKYARK